MISPSKQKLICCNIWMYSTMPWTGGGCSFPPKNININIYLQENFLCKLGLWTNTKLPVRAESCDLSQVSVELLVYSFHSLPSTNKSEKVPVFFCLLLVSQKRRNSVKLLGTVSKDIQKPAKFNGTFFARSTFIALLLYIRKTY